MKKLMTILVLAGVLSVPSAVFAEATWYGSLRPTVEIGGGADARMGDGGSRWGIRGSSEVSEGITAVYRFEHKISTTNAGQPGGRLAYAGLSGGFGTLTMGQVWSASYNATGAITDNSWFYGDSATSYRSGNALSYAITAGALSMQIDAVMDSGTNTSRAVDQLEFGLTVDLGDIGKVAFAHVNKEDTLHSVEVVTQEAVPAVPAMLETEAIPGIPEMYYVIQDDTTDMSNLAERIMVIVAANDSTNLTDDEINTTGLTAISRSNDTYRITSAADCTTNAENTDPADDCVMKTAYVVRTTTITSDAGNTAVNTTTTEVLHIAGNTAGTVGTIDAVDAVEAVYSDPIPAVPEITEMQTQVMPGGEGSKSNHVAAQFGFGGVTMHLGQSQSKKNGSGEKTTVTHYGVAGSLGDTGLSYLVQARKVKAGSASRDPWLLSITRSLGGGATAMIEHGNDDLGKSGKTQFGLKVDF